MRPGSPAPAPATGLSLVRKEAIGVRWLNSDGGTTGQEAFRLTVMLLTPDAAFWGFKCKMQPREQRQAAGLSQWREWRRARESRGQKGQLSTQRRILWGVVQSHRRRILEVMAGQSKPDLMNKGLKGLLGGTETHREWTGCWNPCPGLPKPKANWAHLLSVERA